MSTDPTTTPVSKTPVAVDYTGRDFYSLREELITRVKDRVNTGSGAKWYGNDPSDFGVALIEAFSYMGDVTSYYVDRIANESSLLTATQRQSIVNLALSYGYTPASYRAATCDITFTNTEAAYELATIPAGAQVVGQLTDGDVVRQYTFTTSADVSLGATASVTAIAQSGSSITYTADNSFVAGDYVTVTGATTSGWNVTDVQITSANATSFSVSGTTTGTTSTASASTRATNRTVSAFHGEQVALRDGNLSEGGNDVAGERLGVSTGTASQVFRLRENQVVDGTVRVFVQAGDTESGFVYGEWTPVLHLADYDGTSSVFKIVTDAYSNVYVQFGDGVSGAIPSMHSAIKVQYVYGGGVVGNIPIGTLNSVNWNKLITLTSPEQTALRNAVTSVTNVTRGVGGLDPESEESIRTNAPQAFTTINRAVTLSDFSGLALQTSSVGKANAEADVWTSVTLYVAPQRDANTTDPYPGKDEANTSLTDEWYALQAAVEDTLTPKLQIGTTLTVSPPTYVPVALTIKFSKRTDFTEAQVINGIKSYMAAYYSYAQVGFEQVIHPEEIEFLLRYVPGIYNINVTQLYRVGEDPGRTTLIGTPEELFVFTVSNMVIDPLKSVATLGNLTSSAGTLSPAFGTSILNYNLALPNGTTSVTITPTVTSGSDATVTVNNTLPATAVTTAVGDTVITVRVLAEDNTTFQNYTITATRAS